MAAVIELILWLVMYPMAVALVWGVARLLDKALGVSFRNDIWPAVLDGNVAVAVYFGLRWIGICIVAAYLCSRWIPLGIPGGY